MSEMKTRLNAIERQNRLLKRGLGVVVAVGGAVLLMGQAVPTTVSAQQFLLVDGAGKRRAEMSLAGGAARLLLFDKAKRVRLNLTVQASGQPTMIFYDNAKRPRSMFSTKADGSQAWVLFDDKQRARATMAMRKDGSPLLFFTNSKGKIVKMLPK
jgi:hypothetical protein